MKRTWMVAAVAMVLAVVARAGMPFQIGLAGDPTQIFSSDSEITGLKLNLPYAENDIVTGLDLGLVSGGGEFSALRVNVLNLSESRSSGLEIGALNWDSGDVVGLQLGIVNRAEYAHGLQLGLVNYANHMHGLQIGLLNFIAHTHSAGALPFVNWDF